MKLSELAGKTIERAEYHYNNSQYVVWFDDGLILEFGPTHRNSKIENDAWLEARLDEIKWGDANQELHITINAVTHLIFRMFAKPRIELWKAERNQIPLELK